MMNRHRTAQRLPRLVINVFAVFMCLATFVIPTRAEEPVPPVDARSLVSSSLPAWLDTPLAIPFAPIAARSDALPTRLLLVERQVDVASRLDFAHYAYRIETVAGLQQSGQIRVVFAPSYQTLRWHFLRVWRDGKSRDALDPNSIQLLRQEEDADKFLYHGKITALVILHDLRVGDTIEYGYSLTGINPVFGANYSTTFIGASSTAIDKIFYRIRTAPGRPVNIAPFGEFKAEYSMTRQGEVVDHRWKASDIPAISAVGDAPSHIGQFPYIQITEYGSWGEVRRWAQDLFANHLKPTPELDEIVRTVTAGCTTQDQKAGALLRFVQDDIRYLGLHLLEGTHRPAPPIEVLKRRFGDCKDKSLLLVVLLRHIGMQADVALVNSTWCRGLESLQPSPGAFDHAIVRVARVSAGTFSGTGNYQASFSAAPDTLDSFGSALSSTSYLWLDPTLTLQGGRFDQRYLPNYGFALVLAENQETLVRVTSPTLGAGSIAFSENYNVPDYTSPVSLNLTTTYRGASADAYRYYRRTVDSERYTRELTGYLERFFPKVKALDQVEWTDDRDNNILISRVNLELPDFWKIDPDGRIRRIELYPWALSDRLPRPETMERSVPFALPYPIKWTQTSTAVLPKSWGTNHDSKSVHDDSFDFAYYSNISGPRIDISYEWRTSADSVPADHLAEWSRKMAEVRATLGYQIQQNIRLAEAVNKEGIVWPMLLNGMGGLLAGLAIGCVLFRWRPASASLPPPIGSDHLNGIGGWLLLVAIGVVFRPIRLIMDARNTLQLTHDFPAWITLTDKESVSFNPHYAWVAGCSIAMSGLLFGWSLVMIFQFFRRKASFPRSLMAFIVTALVITIASQIAVNVWTPPTPAPDKALLIGTCVGSVIGSALWFAYLHTSMRVKATFRR